MAIIEKKIKNKGVKDAEKFLEEEKHKRDKREKEKENGDL